MSKKNFSHWAEMLTHCRLEGQSRQQLSRDISLSTEEAYRIQEIGIQHRISRGEKPVGFKMGLTSQAKRKQMNLDSPLYGVLTDRMQIENNGSFFLKGSIHPKIEPEVAFLISHELKGNVKPEQVLDSCAAIAASLEILDSRYEHFKYFSLEDVIADNSSSSHFILGPWVKDFKKINLSDLKMKMKLDGKIFSEGNSKDISGNPLLSVVDLCALLHQRGQSLPAGSIVLAGAATAAAELKGTQQVELEVETLPKVSVFVRNCVKEKEALK